MAQVRKFKTGGTSAKKYGTFTIDNVEHQVTDDFINKLSEYGATLDPQVGNQFNAIIDAVKSGKDLTFNSSGDGSLTGDIQFNVTDKQSDRMGHSRTRAGRFFGGLWGGREQSSRRAISALKGFNYSPTVKREHYDWSDELYGEYAKNDDGSYKLNGDAKQYIDGANNSRILKRISSLLDIANYHEDDKFTGFGDLDRKAYIDFANKLGAEGVKALHDRVLNGTWTAEDAEALNDIGVYLDGKSVSDAEAAEKKDKATRKKNDELLLAAGYDPEKVRDYVIIGDDGEMTLTSLFNQIYNKNGIFNDNWRKSLGANWTGDLEWLLGHTRLGNKLYKTSDLENPESALYKYANQEGGFYDLNAADNYLEADKYLTYLWGQDPGKWNTWDKSTMYNPWFNARELPIKYRPLNGLYQLPEGQELIEYWDSSDRSMFGTPNYKYALFDNGTVKDVDINDYTRIMDGVQSPFTQYQALINDPESPYHGRYIKSYKDPSGLSSDIILYVNPNNPNDVIFENANFGARGPINGRNIRLPEEFVRAIRENYETTNNDFWESLMQNKNLQDRFYRTLVAGNESRMREFMNDVAPSIIMPYEALFGYGTPDVLDTTRSWEKYGFDTNTSQILANLFDEYTDRNGKSAFQRQRERLVAPYTPMMQSGGVVKTTVESKAKDNTKKVQDAVDVTKVAGDNDNWNLSGADKLQIASIAGDVASLLAAIPTGGNPIAGVLGYGSTATQFAADVRRDGLDWGDVGNAALGLTFDTIALLPGAGIAGKLAKMGNVVKKAYPILKTVLLASGAVNGAAGLVKIVNGDATLDDWKKFSMGLLSVKGIGDSIGRRSAIRNMTTKTDTTPTTKKVVNIDKTVNRLKGEPKEKFEKKVVDDAIARGKQLEKPIDYTRLEDGSVAREWANEDGTVHSYSKAYNALRSNGLITDDAIKAALPITAKGQLVYDEVKVTASNAKESAKNWFSNTYDWLYPSLDGRQFRTDLDWRTMSPMQRRQLYSIASMDPEGFAKLNVPFRIGSSKGIMDQWFHNGENWNGSWYYKYPSLFFPKYYNPITTTALPAHKKGGKVQKCENGTLVGNATPKFNLNIKPDAILGIADYLKSRKAIKDSTKEMERGITDSVYLSQRVTPNKITTPYSENGIRQMGQARANAIGTSKIVTSDAGQAIAEQSLKDSYKDQVLAQTNAALAENRAKYNAIRTDEDRKYDALETDTINQNRQIQAQGRSALASLKAQEKTQLAQNDKMLIYQLRRDHNKQLLQRQAVEERLKTSNAMIQYQNELRKLYDSTPMNAEDKKIWGDNWMGYIEEKASSQAAQIKNKYMFDIYKSQVNNPMYQPGWINYYGDLDIQPLALNTGSSTIYNDRVEFKKGGKTRRPIDEQLLLDNNKAVSKASQKLTDHAMKLLLKMLS